MKIPFRVLPFLAAWPGLLLAQAPPAAAPVDPVRPVVLPLPEKNPYACEADAPATIATKEVPGGIETTIPEFVSIRLDHTGKIEEVLLVHDPIPSLEPQQRESF